jgi:spore coat protein A
VSPPEALEQRVVLAAPPAMLAPPLPLLNPLTVPQFVNVLPNPLTQLTPYVPAGVDNNGFNHYDVGTSLITQDLGLSLNGTLKTDLFGYGNPAQGFSYPGRSFVVQKNTPISVTWANGLPSQHVVNVDPTLMDMGFPFTPGATDPTVPAPNRLAPGTLDGGVPIVTHLHGGHTDAVYDGTPLQYYSKSVQGPEYKYESFVYPNDQDASTLWYHDHAMGVTRLNAYAGMAGFYIIRDGADTGLVGNPLGLPAGNYEVPIAIQDKQFLSDGRLWFPSFSQTWNGAPNVASTMPEMFGDVILANGQAWPKLDVQPKRYRLRLLNGSDSRFYTMTLANAAILQTANTFNSAVPFWQIGTEQGLLNAPVKLPLLTIGPGERVDVVVDFTKFKPGTQFILTNSANTPFPGGTRVVAGLTDRIMAFNVVASDGTPDTSKAPATLTNLRAADPIPAPPAVAPAGDQQMTLYETVDGMGRITPLLGDVNTSKTFVDGVDSIPAVYDANGNLKTTQVWEIYNTTADAHPIHLHQVKFQLLSRQAFRARVVATTVTADGTQMLGIVPGSIALQGAAVVPTGAEVSYKDTIQIMPGEVVKVKATWDLPGKYVWHCHILSHEEHDMMRFFQVGAVAYPTPRYVYAPVVPVAPLAPADAVAAQTAVQSLFSTTPIDAASVYGASLPGADTPADTVAGAALDELLA